MTIENDFTLFILFNQRGHSLVFPSTRFWGFFLCFAREGFPPSLSHSQLHFPTNTAYTGEFLYYPRVRCTSFDNFVQKAIRCSFRCAVMIDDDLSTVFLRWKMRAICAKLCNASPLRCIKLQSATLWVNTTFLHHSLRHRAGLSGVHRGGGLWAFKPPIESPEIFECVFAQKYCPSSCTGKRKKL